MRAMHIFGLAAVLAVAAAGADQTIPGGGNAAASRLAQQSPFIQSAQAFLVRTAGSIQDSSLRTATLDAIANPATCVAHRASLAPADKTAILQTLQNQGLLDPADAATFPGGYLAGVFPPVLDDGSACPKLPMLWYAAPGSSFNGHHSYPGGLAVHESFNDQSSQNLAATYRGVYGSPAPDGIPTVKGATRTGDTPISQDLILAAPLWHDWAKPIVFQWNVDGSEFAELNIGGNGVTDNYGASGDSRTGGHHIIGLAEAIRRGLSPDFIITQASAHSAPTSGNEYKVVNWLRAAAILARVDPVDYGLLSLDAAGHLRLPALRALGSVNLTTATGPGNILIEYQIHNLSDADFTNSGPAVTISITVLRALASQFGYDAANATDFNNRFRNPALSYLGAERIQTLFSNGGLPAITAELNKLRQAGVL